MEFDVEHIGKGTVLGLKEDLDSSITTDSTTELEVIIRTLYKSGIKNLVVNFEKIDFIGSCRLRFFDG